MNRNFIEIDNNINNQINHLGALNYNRNNFSFEDIW